MARERSVPNLTEDSLQSEVQRGARGEQEHLPDQNRPQTADQGDGDPPKRPELKQTAPQNRRVVRRNTINDAIVPKSPETTGNLTIPQEASTAQS